MRGFTALQRHGTMGFPEIAAYAIRFARDGFAMNELLAFSIGSKEAAYRTWPQNAAVFLPGGRVPAIGDCFRQTDLADTLQYMSDQATAAGRAGGRTAGGA